MIQLEGKQDPALLEALLRLQENSDWVIVRRCLQDNHDSCLEVCGRTSDENEWRLNQGASQMLQSLFKTQDSAQDDLRAMKELRQKNERRRPAVAPHHLAG